MTNEELKNVITEINDLKKRVNLLEDINKKNKIKKRIYFIIIIVILVISAIVYYFIFKNIYADFINYF